MNIVGFFESIKIGGGVEKFQADLSKGFIDKGYNFTHLLLEDLTPKNKYYGKIFTLNEKFIFGFGLKKIILLFRLGLKVSKYCKKNNVDVIIGQGDFFYMVVSISKILFGNKSKTIGVVHSTIGIWPMFIQKIMIFLLKRLNKVVLISKEEYRLFINNYGFKKDKIEYIPNSIDISNIDILKNQQVTNFEFNKFTFINIGRLTYQKGQDNLIEAFNEFNKKFPEVQLIILGDGELKNQYIHLINKLNNKNIQLLGNTENVYKYLHCSDCFIFTSRFEGFGLVLLEAFACGLPIISTKCPTGPIELLQGGSKQGFEITNNGILTQPDNINDLIHAMELILNDKKLQKKLGDNNLKRVEKFSHTQIFDQWSKLLKNL